MSTQGKPTQHGKSAAVVGSVPINGGSVTIGSGWTWLACHRRAFEWFNGVPRRVISDNPKCALTRACFHDPEVQRADGELAEGYGFRMAPCPPRDPQKKGRVEAGVK